ncbi:unnamed protein product [Nippostrongylus brasiliensis]|uniref:Uncharacterized protein n=1 Tax=Nippostrongylus brasiliensis TaxID=27835 RepID=A0A0N4XQ77_NIPBR|nr:unnamed protein product [Nippostrongylus brasiliensis]
MLRRVREQHEIKMKNQREGEAPRKECAPSLEGNEGNVRTSVRLDHGENEDDVGQVRIS